MVHRPSHRRDTEAEEWESHRHTAQEEDTAVGLLVLEGMVPANRWARRPALILNCGNGSLRWTQIARERSRRRSFIRV